MNQPTSQFFIQSSMSYSFSSYFIFRFTYNLWYINFLLILSYLNINMSKIQYFIKLLCQGTHQKIYGNHILVLKKLYYIQNIITHPISHPPPHIHIYTTPSHTHILNYIQQYGNTFGLVCAHTHTLMNLITSTQFEHMLSGLFQRIASPGI